MRNFLASILFSVFVLSCAHTPSPPPKVLEEGEFWSEQTSRLKALKPITGKMSIHWEGQGESVTGQGRLVSDYPSPFRLEMRDPLGKLQLLVVLLGSDFIAYYPTRNQAYSDKHSGARFFKKMLGLGVSLEDLQALMLGVIPQRWNAGKFQNWKWDDEKKRYVGTAQASGGELQVEVDPALNAVRRMVLNGSESWETEFSDFHWIGESSSGARLAYSVALKSKGRAALIEVEWLQAQVLGQKLDAERLAAKLAPTVSVHRLD